MTIIYHRLNIGYLLLVDTKAPCLNHFLCFPFTRKTAGFC